MLTLLKIKNIALIDQLEIEFGKGLNLLTGETGSGKSIIIDSLGALIGERVSTDLIKQGEKAGRIEGVFVPSAGDAISTLLEHSGIESDSDEIVIRRDLSLEGKNRVFINDQLVTQALLRNLGSELADIHGQGEQTTLYDAGTHIFLLDASAGTVPEKAAVNAAFEDVAALRAELTALKQDESEKLQLVDILKFQVDEIGKAALTPGEDVELEDEKRRLNNIEKLSALSGEAHGLLYDGEHSTLSTLDRAARIINELAGYDDRFRGFEESLEAARATVSELGTSTRDFGGSLEFSPERLNQIEDRLAEISRLKRKYGGSVEAILTHLADAEARLSNIEMAEFREQELNKKLTEATGIYMRAASKLHDKRVAAAKSFSKRVEADLGAVALDKARFEVGIESLDEIRADGTDRVEFYFSANPGEPPRPLAKIASGGEASRLMLILKTAGNAGEIGKTAVFDEIDIGIGGRVAEAVGRKLKALAASQQVFCVTHQPQIASLADRHFVVDKQIIGSKTRITVRELSAPERVEELARMLAGEKVTDQARENARAMLATSAS